MAVQQHDFAMTLRSSGTRIDVFDRYDVVCDMLAPGSDWAFELWRSGTTESAWTELKRAVRVGDQVVFEIDGAPVVNGPIEQVQIQVDRTHGARIVLTGRDMAALALEGDADPRLSLRGVALEDALAQLFNRVGVEVVVGVHADAAREVQTRARPGARGSASSTARRRQRVDLVHARPGEKVWQTAESIVRRLGYMMWIAPSTEGRLAVVVDVPDYDQSPTFRFERRLVEGLVSADSNILESTFDLTLRGVPTYVYAFGMAERGDALGARVRVLYENTALAAYPQVFSPLPPCPRFLHSRRARSPATARQEAMRVMAEGMRNWRTYRCLVQGHGQVVNGARRLYAVNTMATVHDPLSNLRDDMLITRVEFSGSRAGGQTTRLTLGTKGAIQLEPEVA